MCQTISSSEHKMSKSDKCPEGVPEREREREMRAKKIIPVGKAQENCSKATESGMFLGTACPGKKLATDTRLLQVYNVPNGGRAGGRTPESAFLNIKKSATQARL